MEDLATWVSGQVGDKSARRHPTRRQVESATSNSATSRVGDIQLGDDSSQLGDSSGQIGDNPISQLGDNVENGDNGPKYIYDACKLIPL